MLTLSQELRKIEEFIETANKETFNPVGLNVLSPRGVALLFVGHLILPAVSYTALTG